MKKMLLVRYATDDEGTRGVLVGDNFEGCLTIELPWRDNKRAMSCIPTGTYEVYPRESKKYRKHFILKNVHNRSYILIHSGNFGGDATKGYKTHTQGCILPGAKMGKLGGQTAVLSSRPTLRKLREYADGEPFLLTIKSIVGDMSCQS